MRIEDRHLVIDETDFTHVVIDKITEAKRRGFDMPTGDVIGVMLRGRDQEGEWHALWNGPVEICILFQGLPPYRFTHQITWHQAWGPPLSVTGSGESFEEAVEDALVKASAAGWTEPRFWQVWRWGESR